MSAGGPWTREVLNEGVFEKTEILKKKKKAYM